MLFNAYLIVPLATWAIVQVAKFAIAAVRGRLDFRKLYASGGMPSVHSAVVCALATTAYLNDGYSSHLFGFTAVFAAIVMYDSFGVRRSSGEQSVALNMLIASLGRGKIRLDQPELKLREVLGHKPSEVAAGALTGVVLGILFNYNHATALITWLQTIPQRSELIVYGSIFLVVLLASLIQRLIIRRRYPRSMALRKVGSQVLLAGLTTSIIGLVLTVFTYERATYLDYRGWLDLMLAAIVVWGVSLIGHHFWTLPVALKAEANVARKLKWFAWGKRQR